MYEDSGPKDGDMLENRCPLQSAFQHTNGCSTPALQVKWLMPCELCLIHRKSTKDAFSSKLRTFGQKEVPQDRAKIAPKRGRYAKEQVFAASRFFVVAIAVANQPYK